jgi:glycine cleavage system regulatory protein
MNHIVRRISQYGEGIERIQSETIAAIRKANRPLVHQDESISPPLHINLAALRHEFRALGFHALTRFRRLFL